MHAACFELGTWILVLQNSGASPSSGTWKMLLRRSLSAPLLEQIVSFVYGVNGFLFSRYRPLKVYLLDH